MNENENKEEETNKEKKPSRDIPIELLIAFEKLLDEESET